MTYKYGLIPDTPDFRDKLFKVYRLSTGELPDKVDLRINASPIKDQGQLGSCTAFSICSLSEYLKIKDGHDFKPSSELFLYYLERASEGTIRKDNGAQIRTGMKCLNKQGVCISDLWQYIPAKFKTKPIKAAYSDALEHQAISYYRLQTLIDFKQCLADGFPFVCGIAVYESFESEDSAKTGIIPYPKKKEALCGYHAIGVYGYSDDDQWFICKNSWGVDWGDNGWFYLPYKFMTNSSLCSDIWTLRTQEGC